MDIALLGPVELRNGPGTTVPVAGARLRTLLVLLALDAGRAVSTDRLTDSLWGEHAPESASATLHVYISRLRRALVGSSVLQIVPTESAPKPLGRTPLVRNW